MILHLPLKKKWFNMIASGIKTEEYREIKPYWIKRLLVWNWPISHIETFGNGIVKPITHIHFRDGYSKKVIVKKFKTLRIGTPNAEWCEPVDVNKKVFIIEFE